MDVVELRLINLTTVKPHDPMTVKPYTTVKTHDLITVRPYMTVKP